MKYKACKASLAFEAEEEGLADVLGEEPFMSSFNKVI